MNQALLLKPNEAAAALAISPRLLWSLTQSGDVPCVRIGRAVRYDPRDLTVWIDRQKGLGEATRSERGKHQEGP